MDDLLEADGEMTWLQRLNQVLRVFGLLRVRIVDAEASETVAFRWMRVKTFKRLGGKWE